MPTISMRGAVSGRERSLVRRIWAAYKAYLVKRQHHLSARTLAGLSDHTLKDMGITRSEIHALVYSRSVDQRYRHEDADAG
jgi:uncharacterized protein YjiS (DUF1127 family)